MAMAMNVVEAEQEDEVHHTQVINMYMGLNVHVKCKYMCNRANLVIKGSHVKV